MRLISGHVHRYDVIITFQSVVVIDETRIVTRQLVPEMREFIANAEIITLGWAAFPDFEVIYIYNKDDDNFGYAVNLQDPTLSEWGYAPFRN
jgi:hypothetical protein